METTGTQTIKESCEQFRQKNGNDNYSNKDLLIHLLNKVDNIGASLTTQVTFCKTHLAEKKGFKNYAFQIITFLIAFTAIVVAVT